MSGSRWSAEQVITNLGKSIPSELVTKNFVRRTLTEILTDLTRRKISSTVGVAKRRNFRRCTCILFELHRSPYLSSSLPQSFAESSLTRRELFPTSNDAVTKRDAIDLFATRLRGIATESSRKLSDRRDRSLITMSLITDVPGHKLIDPRQLRPTLSSVALGRTSARTRNLTRVTSSGIILNGDLYSTRRSMHTFSSRFSVRGRANRKRANAAGAIRRRSRARHA